MDALLLCTGPAEAVRMVPAPGSKRCGLVPLEWGGATRSMQIGRCFRGSRLPAVQGIAAAALLIQTQTATVGAIAAGPAPAPLAMATAAMQRLDADFYSPHFGLYAITGDKYGPTASLWPTSQVLNAAIQVAALTHAPADLERVRRIIDSFARYKEADGVYHTRAFPSRRYTDDNNWVALDLLDAYALLHDTAYLATARRLFGYLVSNWDPNGGGIIWQEQHPDRPTVSTAPVISIGMRLAALSDRAYYSSWADRCYRWENAHLRSPAGLYWDHIRAEGGVDTTLRSYNQGVMIGANLDYAGTSSQRSYLHAAARLAAAAAAALAGHLQDHGGSAAYDAIYFQALGRLAAADPGAASAGSLRAYLAWAWPIAKAPRTRKTEPDLQEQAAFVISAASLAAWRGAGGIAP